MAKSLVDLAWDALASTRCACGAQKLARRSFCSKCYYSLPRNLQMALYKSMSDGYAEVFDEAMDWLKINTDRIS